VYVFQLSTLLIFFKQLSDTCLTFVHSHPAPKEAQIMRDGVQAANGRLAPVCRQSHPDPLAIQEAIAARERPQSSADLLDPALQAALAPRDGSRAAKGLLDPALQEALAPRDGSRASEELLDPALQEAQPPNNSLDRTVLQLTQDIVDAEKSQVNEELDETESQKKVERTAEEVYEDLRNEILDDVLDRKSDDEEFEIACILGEHIKSVSTSLLDNCGINNENTNPEPQASNDESNEIMQANQIEENAEDQTQHNPDDNLDDRSEFVRNFDPDVFEICPKTGCRLYNFPAPPAQKYRDAEAMTEDVKQFALRNGYAIVLRRTVEMKSKLYKCDR
jgi:hypothetical protein